MINGDTETGATTFFLTHEIDTGKIIRQKHLPIADTDDVGIVHDGLMTMGAGLVLETVDLLLEGKQMPFLRKNFIKILPNSVLLRRFSKKLAVSTGFSR